MPIAAHIRQAAPDDAFSIARLSSQLGYPASDPEIHERIARLLSSRNHSVFVAEVDRIILGWVSGEIRLSLETGTRVEITGLVVDASARRAGIGRGLVAAIEHWASQHHITVILVRSNLARTESHPFYERIGYQQVKTQHSYRRELQTPRR